MAGHSVAELTAIGEEVYDEVMADQIWPGTRALAMRHLDAGQEVWLVTATPVEVAQVIAHRLGLSGALGTVAESVDGVYTGRLVGSRCTVRPRPTAVAALAEREGPGPVPVRGVLRLGQRHPAALARRPPLRDQPRRGAARARPRARLAGRGLPPGRRAAKLGLRAAAATALAGALAASARRRRS